MNQATASPLLPQEEYVEQAFLYKTLSDRLKDGEPIQNLLTLIREEILATTKLPIAIDFIHSELNHTGIMASALRKLPHYFNPFQTYLIAEAERDTGRFDLRTALAILEKDAIGKSEKRSKVATFFFQFETLCRNTLQYDHGLSAVAYDPVFDSSWHQWILDIRRKLGTVTLADLVFIHSEHYATQQNRQGLESFEIAQPILFGEKEGKIALANRRKEETYFFSALQRQLKYPPAPRVQKNETTTEMVPRIQRQLERLEVRIKLLEDEQREKGIDLTKFYERPE
ncbi:MAG: hypothetical protein VX438_18270 [Planctomycetota bacterium]|nr:hypothetical protein [Planctomycetota bacterium]